MATVDQASNQATLESLYEIRSKLYSMSVQELNDLSAQDQLNYTQSLHQINLAIQDLEDAKMKQVNEVFKANEQTLVDKTQTLQDAVKALTESVSIINTISHSIELIATLAKLAAA